MVQWLRPSNAGGAGSIPGRGAKIPHASQPKNQNIKQKQYCNKFNKDFKKMLYLLGICSLLLILKLRHTVTAISGILPDIMVSYFGAIYVCFKKKKILDA